MQVTIEKDGNGFLAKVLGTDELYAFGFSQQDAIRELSNVIEMMEDTVLPFQKKSRFQERSFA